MELKSKADAQKRADQIGAFQSELELIQQEQIVTLDEQQQEAISQYHKNLIGILADNFYVDFNSREKQLSLGMKIVSFLVLVRSDCLLGSSFCFSNFGVGSRLTFKSLF